MSNANAPPSTNRPLLACVLTTNLSFPFLYPNQDHQELQISHSLFICLPILTLSTTETQFSISSFHSTRNIPLISYAFPYTCHLCSFAPASFVCLQLGKKGHDPPWRPDPPRPPRRRLDPPRPPRVPGVGDLLPSA